MTQANNRSPFGKWYDQHKDSLSEKRKQKYQDDPEYRKKAIARARRYRQDKSKSRTDLPHEYKYSAREAADTLGVTTNELRAWRLRDHYPTPFELLGRTYFTEKQVSLLKNLENFLSSKGPKIKQSDREDFENLKAMIYANWSE